MVATAKVAANFFEREPRVLSREEHANLPRHRDRLVSLLGQKVGQFDIIKAGDALNDRLQARRISTSGGDFAIECQLGEFERDGLAGRHGVAADSGQCSLKLTDVGVDLCRDVGRDIIRQRNTVELGLRLDDRNPRFEAGPLDPGDKTGRKATGEPLLEIRNLCWRCI